MFARFVNALGEGSVNLLAVHEVIKLGEQINI